MFKFGMISSIHITYYELITTVEALEIVFGTILGFIRRNKMLQESSQRLALQIVLRPLVLEVLKESVAAMWLDECMTVV
jgi:hypothetical protein